MCDQCVPEGPDYGLLQALERFTGLVVEYQTPTGRWARGRAADACGYDPVHKIFVLPVFDGPMNGAHVTDPSIIRLPVN